MRILLLLFFLIAASTQGAGAQGVQWLDDFEAYDTGALPTKWKYLHEGDLVPVSQEHMRPRERFYVVDSGPGRALRVYTKGEAVHLSMANEDAGFDWDLQDHPGLAWSWRALQLPPGAREDIEELNDTAAGLYVIFAMDGLLFKRPRTIKYAYSATLPVGTLVSYGKLKVIVVSSALDGSGMWKEVERDVVADYRRAFGGTPPRRPLSIRLWSDSDNTDSEAEADFDDIRLLPPNTR